MSSQRISSPRTPLALAVSAGVHALLAVAIVIVMRGTRSVPAATVQPTPSTASLVWLNLPGPSGGGGGGGNRQKDPPRRAERPGHDAITVPVARPPSFEPTRTAAVEPDPMQPLTISAKSVASATESLPGAIDAPPGPPTLSTGPGKGGGSRTGNGTGDGPGNGSGLGDGNGGNTGGDGYRIGNGVTPPIEISHGTPQYTTDAMRARIQGAVIVECVVQTTGICSNVRVVRSLDRAFGLDQEAIKTAGQWRFRPGTRMGRPVPVFVTMEIAFTLR